MPGRDGKGPQGTGAGTGGRKGPCFDVTGQTGAGEQRSAGQGFAPRGGGRGPGFGTGPQAEDSAQALKSRAAVLERELDDVRRRLKDDAGKQV